RATLTATGANVAQGRDGATARLAFSAVLGAGAELTADPGPLVVAHGSRVAASVHLDLAADAAVRWSELVVLGRSGEAAGDATLRWDVGRDGRPVLRQQVDVAASRHRVLASTFVTAPDLDARTTVLDPTAVGQRVDARTLLVTVVGDDAAEVRDRLTQLARAEARASRTNQA
ncbi:MAG: urease accessory protein UreD, partial [Actinobacteria bacterium]|nr:urease accessory protein UreD [Actinomycetota bacterium]